MVRRRRQLDDRDERGSGPSQEEVTWARYYGIRSVPLPNVRLGMRNPPTATDWRRFWNATAAEPVLTLYELELARAASDV